MSFEAKTEQFEKWLAKNVNVSSKIQIVDYRHAGFGRCVVATQDIEEGEDLFTIPTSNILNVALCSLVEDHPSSKETLLDMSQWDALILVLAYEVKNSNSRWMSYLDVLPISDNENYKFDQLMFWSDEELKMLQPSLIIDRIGLDSANEMYQRLSPLFHRYVGEVSKEEFFNIATLIMSYSFDVKNGREDADTDEEPDTDEEEDPSDQSLVRDSGLLKSMVPLADTLNADTKKHNASLMYDSKALVMRSISKILKGDQVYNIYSQHPNSELLRRYGYVEEAGSAHDFAEIPLLLVVDYFSEKLGLLKKTVELLVQILSNMEQEEDETIVMDTFDCYVSGEVSFELIFLVQFLVIMAAVNSKKLIHSETNLTRGAKRVFKKCYQLIESKKLTNDFVKHFNSIIECRMKAYPLSAKEFQPLSVPMTRDQLARTVLFSEYKSLEECLHVEGLFTNGDVSYSLIDDDKLMRNIMKKDIFEADSAPPIKKQKREK